MFYGIDLECRFGGVGVSVFFGLLLDENFFDFGYVWVRFDSIEVFSFFFLILPRNEIYNGLGMVKGSWWGKAGDKYFLAGQRPGCPAIVITYTQIAFT